MDESGRGEVWLRDILLRGVMTGGESRGCASLHACTVIKVLHSPQSRVCLDKAPSACNTCRTASSEGPGSIGAVVVTAMQKNPEHLGNQGQYNRWCVNPRSAPERGGIILAESSVLQASAAAKRCRYALSDPYSRSSMYDHDQRTAWDRTSRTQEHNVQADLDNRLLKVEAAPKRVDPAVVRSPKTDRDVSRPAALRKPETCRAIVIPGSRLRYP